MTTPLKLTPSLRLPMMPTMSRPEIFVIAGPNGAGKSTVAALVLPKRFHVNQFVNADVIQHTLGPAASPITAGRIMLKRMRELRDAGETFAFETTLAARSYVPFLRDAQHAGYFIHLAFISLSSPNLAKSRVADRVREGGHDIPPADIERRYWRGLRNFFEYYRPLADAWTLCDNSGDRLLVVAQGSGADEPTIIHKTRYAELKDAAKRKP